MVAMPKSLWLAGLAVLFALLVAGYVLLANRGQTRSQIEADSLVTAAQAANRLWQHRFDSLRATSERREIAVKQVNWERQRGTQVATRLSDSLAVLRTRLRTAPTPTDSVRHYVVMDTVQNERHTQDSLQLRLADSTIHLLTVDRNDWRDRTTDLMRENARLTATVTRVRDLGKDRLDLGLFSIPRPTIVVGPGCSGDPAPVRVNCHLLQVTAGIPIFGGR